MYDGCTGVPSAPVMARSVRATFSAAGLWTGGPDKPGHDDGDAFSIPPKLILMRIGTSRAMTERAAADIKRIANARPLPT
jgi:hypothetical protein